jgi:hypothetical protein
MTKTNFPVPPHIAKELSTAAAVALFIATSFVMTVAICVLVWAILSVIDALL